MAESIEPSKIFRISGNIKGCNWTTLTEKDVPRKDMTGKWIIITGANNGIGFEAAKTFAEWGANIILACREPPAWENHPTVAVEECQDIAKSAGHTSSIEYWPIDMADLDTVDAFAKRWVETGRALDILCNNAGIAPHSTNEQDKTKDGFQILHQVNLISHVLLTYRLLDSLAASAEPRIVCTTSVHHFRGFFNPTEMNECSVRPVYARGDIYANNKLYYQTWVTEANRRFTLSEKYRHITINGVNPGFVNSGIWKFSDENSATFMGAGMRNLMAFFANNFAITPSQGSFALVNAASSAEFGPNPEVQGRGEPRALGGGHYINRIWKAVPMPYCEHPASRLQVWSQINEELRSVRSDLEVLEFLDGLSESPRGSRDLSRL